MPTERFYRLPREKREIIRQAAVDEFARVTFDKVSINQIIQNANISRGSFYTYFEDKLDVLRYIFEEIKYEMVEFCKNSLEDSKGDFWYMTERMLDCFLRTCYEHRLLEIVKNIRMFSESHFMNLFGEPDQCSEEDEGYEVWIYEHIDKSVCPIDCKNDFHCLMEMCAMNLMAAVRDLFKTGDAEYIKKKFCKKLEILRYGICKSAVK